MLFVAVWRSKKIFTVTNFVKDDMVKTFRLAKEKVIVAPNAVSAHFKRSDESKITRILPKYGVKQPYIFYFGNAHPHKNVEGLLKAFEIVSKKRPDLHLVLGGKKYFFYERIEKEWKNSEIFPKLNFIDFVNEEELPTLLSGAEVFVNPSKYEGFGLQLLEAFSCGTRVVCSNKTSLPEVGGDAAYYFDPYDPKDMAKGILEALEDTTGEKIRLGSKRVKSYSWQESARKILELYKSI